MDMKLNAARRARAPAERWRLLGPALRIAHARPIVASLLLGSIVLGLTLSSWIPLAVGLPALVVFIGRCLLSRRVWRAAAEVEATKAVELPATATMTDRTARALLERIVGARTELEDALGVNAAPGGTEVLVRLRSVREIERAAVATLYRIELLAGAPAGGGRPSFIPSEPESGASETQSFLQRAAAARAERLEAIRELSVRRQRELARLEYLTSCLEAIPAALMELHVLERDVLDRGLPDAVIEADTLREEVRHVREEIVDGRV
jgi:hypothetical protein